MKRFINDDNELVAGINVTPIIDVALVLVIIMMITAPMLSVLNMDVELPQAQTRSIEDEARLSITLGKEGELAIDEDLISPQAFVSVLGKRIAEAADNNILVVVRADSKIPYDRVREVIKIAKKAGAKRIAIATRQRGQERM